MKGAEGSYRLHAWEGAVSRVVMAKLHGHRKNVTVYQYDILETGLILGDLKPARWAYLGRACNSLPALARPPRPSGPVYKPDARAGQVTP